MKRIRAVGMLVMAQAAVVVAQNGLQLGPATKPVIIDFLPQVADLDKAERFYHQLLGLESLGGDPRARLDVWFPTRPFLEDMYGIGGKLRNFYLNVPVSNLMIEPLQWANAKGKPGNPRLQDPGATLLVLKVNNIDALTRRMVKGGAKVITTGGRPIAEGNLAAKKRVIVFEDFNGFFTELVQIGVPQVVTEDVPQGPMSFIEGSDITVTVSDLDRNAKFYSDILGLEVKSETAFGSEAGYLNALGIKGAEYREARITLPDKTPQLHLVEFRGIERKTLTPLVPDPNATVLRITVPDFESVLVKIRTSPDVKIMNTGGRPVSPFADGSGRFLIVLPPGGSTYLQLTEVRRPR